MAVLALRKSMNKADYSFLEIFKPLALGTI
jgi:hypothetical protein